MGTNSSVRERLIDAIVDTYKKRTTGKEDEILRATLRHMDDNSMIAFALSLEIDTDILFMPKPSVELRVHP